MSDALNPYAAPAAHVEDVGTNSEAEAIRREHINHEATIKSVGILYYLGGILMSLGMIAAIGGALGSKSIGADAGFAVILMALAAAQIGVGWGVRVFKPWARIAGCVLSGLGLLAFPIGTLVNAYILYLLLSKKGRMVFSPEYRDIVEATPHVKYRTSIVVWVFLAILLGLILIGVVGAFVGS